MKRVLLRISFSFVIYFLRKKLEEQFNVLERYLLRWSVIYFAEV